MVHKVKLCLDHLDLENYLSLHLQREIHRENIRNLGIVDLDPCYELQDWMPADQLAWIKQNQIPVHIEEQEATSSLMLVFAQADHAAEYVMLWH